MEKRSSVGRFPATSGFSPSLCQEVWNREAVAILDPLEILQDRRLVEDEVVADSADLTREEPRAVFWFDLLKLGQQGARVTRLPSEQVNDGADRVSLESLVGIELELHHAVQSSTSLVLHSCARLVLSSSSPWNASSTITSREAPLPASSRS